MYFAEGLAVDYGMHFPSSSAVKSDFQEYWEFVDHNFYGSTGGNGPFPSKMVVHW